MGNVRLYGSTSGYTELAPPAIAPDGVLTLPSGTGTLATAAYVDAAQAAATAAGIAGGGLVAVAPTSIANSGGSASTTGFTTTFTGVSVISINDVFLATYENYRVLINLTGISASMNIFGRLRVGGTDASGSNYQRNWIYVNNGSAAGVRYASQSSWEMANVAINQEVMMSIDLFRPFTVSKTFAHQTVGPMVEAGGAVWRFGPAGLEHDGATSYPGFSLITSTGNITGTITVYGYAK
jgi:hypothetical protein